MTNTKGKYFIVGIGKRDGIEYYYHSNKHFYWNFHNLPSCQFKSWKVLKYAEDAFCKINNSSGYFSSISLKFCEYGKNIKTDSITIKTKQYEYEEV